MKPTGRLSVRSKIWIVDEQGKVVFGAGRLRILEAIDRAGSILAAAKELQMSYRAVWGKIPATEQRLGRPLLTKKIGGSRGGGSDLTPFAKALAQRYRTLQALTEAAADRLFEDVFTRDMPENQTKKD
ncbi:molybdate transport system regulatory protein [Desulfacinum hydrothermale DSM 13146]|uniref:Molybdate transport system regulatory protein n=1 Tax=Desulfacinum hydrothermale DSM 13146 TaxID=1121390 RepID=A0A1W1XUV5_9BACT|nr:LysR family transcriptional regulator [Desulfacinum hydrothermale]SMC27645.1 molybdate transport system regulatory protein [Desulfacinum hydrothermale DSM 13146]